MNEIEMLGRLVSASRTEEVPCVDVSRKVLLSLSVYSGEPDRSFTWIAGLSLAATLPIVLLAVYALDALYDPFPEIFLSLSGVLL